MKRPRLNLRRSILLAAAAFLVAGLAAPYLSADFIGDRIRLALERSLHRRVEIEAARFNLFRGPGFSLLQVVIHDDPSAGREPLAFVSAVEARISLLGLLRGRLEFSALRLEQPSVNLVKAANGPWNFQTLFTPGGSNPIPAISVRQGRLNFKIGGAKSVFYFSNADLDLQPPHAPGGAFGVEFAGEPTRSDRTARGFGAVSGKGQWRPSPEPGGNLQLEVRLERSSLGELVTLVRGYDIGIHGQVSGQATARGPLSSLELAGTLQLDEIHRWDLLPPYAQGGPLNFRGHLDSLNQVLDLETVSSPQTALLVHFRASNYLVQPRWVMGATLRGVALPPLVEVARHMGAALANDVKMDGAVTGALDYSPEAGLQGSIALDGTTINSPAGPAVRLEQAKLVLDGDRVLMPAAAVDVGGREKAAVQFEYRFSTQSLDLRLTTKSMSVAALQSAGGPLPGLTKPGFVGDLRGGVWKGWLEYRRQGDQPGAWAGALELQHTQVDVPGLTEPLAVASAAVRVQGGRLGAERVKAALAGVEIDGDYSYTPEARHPHRLTCRADKLRVADLARSLEPTLHRRQGFLSRTLRLARPAAVPEWLDSRFVEGSVSIGSLELAGQSIEGVRLNFFWDGPRLDVPRFTARAQGGRVEGLLSVSFSGVEPVYYVAGRAESLAWQGGKLDGDAEIRTAGTGEAVYRNLLSAGGFRLQSVTLGGDAPVPSLTGGWSFRFDRDRPRLELSDLRMNEAGQLFTGKGSTTEDDRLLLELAGADTRLRFAGTLKPLRLELVESR